MKNRATLLPLLILTLLFFLVSKAFAIGDYFTVYDEEGEIIFYTGEYTLFPGDRYINQKNREFLVISVHDEKKEALVKDLGEVDLLGHILGDGSVGGFPLMAGKDEKKIAIYHTHTEESFVPTSGTHDKPGEGDIFEVGKTFKGELEKRGITVFHDLTKHEPRDAASYDRSKATAKNLLEKGPDAIFDIHRDGVPNKEEYTTQIDGQLTSMVRFVVGRENPNRGVIEDFAKELKAAADKIEPGLIKGILFSHGKYNQELSSHALLFEIGTHLNTLEEAQRGAALMAWVVADFFYGEGDATVPSERHGIKQQRSALTTVVWLVLLVSAFSFFFLYLNEGSFEKALRRLKGMIRRVTFTIKDKGEGEE